LEVVPGVHSIPGGRGPFVGFFAPNVYLVVGKEGALIDAGCGDEALMGSMLDYVREFHGLRLACIVITHAHPDHIGGASRIKEATGADIALHSHNASQYSRVLADKVVEDGDTLAVDGVALEVIHTPGHSAGHICILLKEEGICFSGDHVLGLGTTAMMPPEGDMAQYIASLRKLLDYDIRLICPGHGSPIAAPRRKLEELIEHRLAREQQVLNGVQAGRETIAELVQHIYPELDSRLYQAAEGQVLAHLIKLEREGKVAPPRSEADAGYTAR
jgi:glyoxylase-like metal-dependent hydrolase (beta-lactamase superfamily II)